MRMLFFFVSRQIAGAYPALTKRGGGAMRRHRKGKILLCVTLTGLLLIPAMAAAVLRPKLAVYA